MTLIPVQWASPPLKAWRLDIESDSQLQGSQRSLEGNTPMIRSLAGATLLAIAASAAILRPIPAPADEPIRLTIKDHRFVPDQITAPAGVRFQIAVSNQDPTPGEFESRELRVEKIVAAGSTISVMAGPLKPGTYKFFDDYHPDTATGTLTAIEKKSQQ
jgi:Cupredoxin-like domain